MAMKQTVFLFAAILLLAASAGAQVDLGNSLPLAPATPEANAAIAPGATSLFAIDAAPTVNATSGNAGAAFRAPGSSSTDQQQPSVFGVFQNYNWQATAGYTFFRFYALPHVADNMNGINLGLTYYPGGKWFAADGEFVGAWGTNYGLGVTKYVQGMGGGRARWSAPRGIEVWGHALVGGTHFLPQTALGSSAAFAYEAGGGVDLNLHQRRIAYRISANMIGTRYFGTFQYNPDLSIGVVFKF
jgi:hypothetical protein